MVGGQREVAKKKTRVRHFNLLWSAWRLNLHQKAGRWNTFCEVTFHLCAPYDTMCLDMVWSSRLLPRW